MDTVLSSLTKEFNFSGNLPKDAAAFLNHHECPKTATHSWQVANTAERLAQRFGLDQVSAAQAGWLHDISAVIPNKNRLETAQRIGLEVLPEEEEVPLLLHQKISAAIASQLFNLRDPSVLGAIGCHTTLKPSPDQMDLLLFAADKLSWDQKGIPPYAAAMETALSRSLEEAAWVYQDYLWHSGKLKIIHPWMRASYQELQTKFG